MFRWNGRSIRGRSRRGSEGGALILVRKTGYLEYLAFDKFYGWFKDMTDMAGFSRERRTFLAVRMEANKAHTLEEMLATIGDALEMLRFDRAELHLKNRAEINRDSAHFSGGEINRDSALFSEGGAPSAALSAGPDRRKNRDSAPLRQAQGDRAVAQGDKEGGAGDGNPGGADKPGGADTKNRDSAPLRQAQGDKEGGAGGGNPGGSEKPSGGAQPPAPTSTKIFEDILELGDEIVWMWSRGYYRRRRSFAGSVWNGFIGWFPTRGVRSGRLPYRSLPGRCCRLKSSDKFAYLRERNSMPSSLRFEHECGEVRRWKRVMRPVDMA